MRLTREKYIERGMHRAVPTSLVDAIELGFADAAAADYDETYGRIGIEALDEVEDYFYGSGLWGMRIVVERIVDLPEAVSVTPADAMAAFDFVKSEVGCFEKDHIILDAILCLIATRAGFVEFTEAFEDKSKAYA